MLGVANHAEFFCRTFISQRRSPSRGRSPL